MGLEPDWSFEGFASPKIDKDEEKLKEDHILKAAVLNEWKLLENRRIVLRMLVDVGADCEDKL